MPLTGGAVGDMTKAVYDSDLDNRIEKDALEIALNKLLRGAGAGANPVEVDAYEWLAEMYRAANVLHIPGCPIGAATGWQDGHAGSGGAQGFLSYHLVWTGVTANSRGKLHTPLAGFAQEGGSLDLMNWGKKLIFVFNYARYDSDVQVIARVQLKETNTEGALAAKGIGLRADNYALVGESYGIALGTVSLGVTLTDFQEKQIVIIHDPSVPKIEWWVNGTLVGTQSTANNIPSGMGGSTLWLVHSIINGPAGGVDAYSYLMHSKLWQKR